MGITLNIDEDSVEVIKGEIDTSKEVTFDGHNDHRIVMALSLLSAKINIAINGYEAINKSYPNYFEELVKLGGKVRYE